MRISQSLIAMAAFAATGLSSTAGAQEIVLYDQTNFGGQSVVVTGSVGNLTRQNFNDRASSLRIVSGVWELCVHDNFSGECITYNGDEANLGRFSNQYTSLRPVSSGYDDSDRGGRRGALTLYSGPNYTGRSITLDQAQTDFSRIGFNDTAQSIRYDGRRSWRVCQHANYGGACMEVSGDMPSLAGLTRQISSAEPDRGTRRGGNRPRSGLWLYDGADYEGQRIEVQNDVSDLTRLGFNDRADSLIIARGEAWEVCEHANYRGRCEVFEGDRVDGLARLNFRNTISSARRVDEIYGYPGSGYPGPGGGYGNSQIRGGVRGVNSTFFARPEINGFAVDQCMASGGRDCGQEAAHQVCHAAGHENVAYFNFERTYRARTWHMGSNRECRTGQCAALVDVLCVN